MKRAKAPQLFPVPDDTAGAMDMLIFERVRVFWKQVGQCIRELEAYKQKRNICTRGLSCTRQAVRAGGCAHHYAARKAKVKLHTWTAYSTEYGKLRLEQRAAEREAERKRKEEAAKALKRKPPKKVAA